MQCCASSLRTARVFPPATPLSPGGSHRARAVPGLAASRSGDRLRLPGGLVPDLPGGALSPGRPGRSWYRDGSRGRDLAGPPSAAPPCRPSSERPPRPGGCPDPQAGPGPTVSHETSGPAPGRPRLRLRQQGVVAHSPRHQVQTFDTRRLAVEGRPRASRAQAASWPALRSSPPVLALPVRRLPRLLEGNC